MKLRMYKWCCLIKMFLERERLCAFLVVHPFFTLVCAESVASPVSAGKFFTEMIACLVCVSSGMQKSLDFIREMAAEQS